MSVQFFLCALPAQLACGGEWFELLDGTAQQLSSHALCDHYPGEGLSQLKVATYTPMYIW